MKKQINKLEKLRILAEAKVHGVAPSEIKIIGDLVLVCRVDPHILQLMPDHLPSMRHAVSIPKGIKLCSRSQSLLTSDDKLMLVMSVNNYLHSLKQGCISDIDFARLQTTLQVGMEALARATPQMTDQEYCIQRYNKAYEAAKAVLDDMNARRERVGAYKATGDNLRCIEVLIGLLAEAVEFITVGEWYGSILYLVDALTKISIEQAKAKAA